jgi:hypothetical protein
MLHHWLTSQKGFNSRWQQACRIYLNFFLISFKNDTKLKIIVQMYGKFSNFFLKYI